VRGIEFRAITRPDSSRKTYKIIPSQQKNTTMSGPLQEGRGDNRPGNDLSFVFR